MTSAKWTRPQGPRGRRPRRWVSRCPSTPYACRASSRTRKSCSAAPGSSSRSATTHSPEKRLSPESCSPSTSSRAFSLESPWGSRGSWSKMGLVLGQVLTAVVTPFAEDGSLNVEAFKRLCVHLVENGSDGIVVAGTTGEAPTLSDEERLALFAAAIEAVGDRAKVVA